METETYLWIANFDAIENRTAVTLCRQKSRFSANIASNVWTSVSIQFCFNNFAMQMKNAIFAVVFLNKFSSFPSTLLFHNRSKKQTRFVRCRLWNIASPVAKMVLHARFVRRVKGTAEYKLQLDVVRLFQWNKTRAVGGTNTWPTVLDWFVWQREFAQVVANHFWFHFNLIAAQQKTRSGENIFISWAFNEHTIEGESEVLIGWFEGDVAL